MMRRTRRLLTATAAIALVAWPPLDAAAQDTRLARNQIGAGVSADRPSTTLSDLARIRVDGVTAAEALATLRDRTGLRLLFSPSLLPDDARVSCDCERRTIREALERILDGTGFEFREVGRHVLIEPERTAPLEPNGANGEVWAPLLVSIEPVSPAVRAGWAWRQPRPATAGEVLGQVVDGSTGRALAGAQVEVPEHRLGSVTDADGRYRIGGVSAGEVTVRVTMIGFARTSRTVTVRAGQTVVADFVLRHQVLPLDEFIVTGRGAGAARREIGSSVARISTAEMESAPINSMSDLLQARAPGVHILGSGGQPGLGSRILLRGIASLSQSNTPVIYVDGVRMDNSPFRGIRTEGPAWAGFDDINPADIENIEIVRGASAATLYGTEAAAGVINITTRRGVEGAPQWRLRTELGVSAVPQSYWDESGSVFAGWYGDQMGRSGSSHSTQLSVRGGTDMISYYASGTLRGEGGIEPNSRQDYGSFRANLQIRPSEKLSVGVSAGYSSREVMVPPQTNNQEGFLINGLLTGNEGQFGSHRTLDLIRLEMFQRGYRFTGSTIAEYAATPSWSHRLTLGADFFNSDNTEFLPPDVVLRFSGGYAGNYRRIAQNLNLDYSTTYRTELTGSLRSSTTAGFQAFRSEAGIQSAFGEDFAFTGLRVVGATATNRGGESRSEERMVGFFAEQQLGFRDLAFVTVGARADGHSAFGAEVDYEVYPKVDLSYVVSEHAFWDPEWGSLRLRGAYGTAGMQPSAFAAVRTYGAVAGAGGDPAIVPSNIGNPELSPEVSHELELGFDATVWNDRLNVELTFYDQTTKDALFLARNVPSLGILGTQLRNVGEVANRGIELGVHANVLHVPGFRWDVRGNVSTNSNEVVSLSDEAPLQVRWLQHIREGFPIGAFFASDHLIEHDGQVVNKRDLCAEPGNCTDAEQFIGPAQPTRTVQLGSDFTLRENVRFGFLLDHHGGHYRHDHTMRWMLDPRRSVSEERAATYAEWGVTPGPVSNRCREAAEDSLDAAICGRNSLLTQGEFAVPADWWRLREVTFSYRLPRHLAGRVRAANASVSLAGRNLWRWQESPGLEPESNMNTQSTLQRHSFFPTPYPRQFVAGVTLDF